MSRKLCQKSAQQAVEKSHFWRCTARSSDCKKPAGCGKTTLLRMIAGLETPAQTQPAETITTPTEEAPAAEEPAAAEEAPALSRPLRSVMTRPLLFVKLPRGGIQTDIRGHPCRAKVLSRPVVNINMLRPAPVRFGFPERPALSRAPMPMTEIRWTCWFCAASQFAR